jgi:hypothetical protein
MQEDLTDEPKNFLGMTLSRYNYPQKTHFIQKDHIDLSFPDIKPMMSHL